MQRNPGAVETPAGKYEKASRKAKQVKTKVDPLSPIAAILKSQPFFGGVDPAGTTVPAAQAPPVSPPADPPANDPKDDDKSDTKSGGSDDDPIAKLAADPNALGQLLAQVDTLTKSLEEKSTALSAYEEEKQKAARAQQTKEEQLESDLAQRDAVIQQMDVVIKNMAINNAMMSQKDLQWNSVKQAVAELQEGNFEIDVDLAKGTAIVTGIDKEAQRIAKDFPWLVAKGAAEEPPVTPTRQQPRRPATPPAPPGGDTGKQERRSKLMKRYPVLAAGSPI